MYTCILNLYTTSLQSHLEIQTQEKLNTINKHRGFKCFEDQILNVQPVVFTPNDWIMVFIFSVCLAPTQLDTYSISQVRIHCTPAVAD